MDNRKTVIVGIATFILLSILATLLIWQSNFFKEIAGYTLTGRFNQIGGLLKGSEVRYRGYNVGQVKRIIPNPEHIDVLFIVEGSIKIPEGSTIKILFDGLVGENYVSIEAKPGVHTFLKDKDIIKGKSGSDLANFIDLGSQNLVHTEEILLTLKRMVTDEGLFNGIKTTVENLESITNILLENVSGTNTESLSTLITNLNDISNNTKKITSQLSQDQTLSALNNSILNIEKSSSELSNILNKNNANDIQDIIKNFKDISTNINQLLGKQKTKSPHILASLSSLRFGTNTGVFYNNNTQNGHFNTNFELGLGQYSLITGLGNKAGTTKLQHFQQSYFLSKNIRSRFGIIHNAEGLGLDYYLTNRFRLSANLFDFNNTYFLVSSYYTLYKAIDVQLNMRNDNQNKDTQLDLGVNYQF